MDTVDDNGYLRQIVERLVRLETTLDGLRTRIEVFMAESRERKIDVEARLRALEREQDQSSYPRQMLSKAITYIVMAVLAAGVALIVGQS